MQLLLCSQHNKCIFLPNLYRPIKRRGYPRPCCVEHFFALGAVRSASSEWKPARCFYLCVFFLFFFILPILCNTCVAKSQRAGTINSSWPCDWRQIVSYSAVAWQQAKQNHSVMLAYVCVCVCGPLPQIHNSCLFFFVSVLITRRQCGSPFRRVLFDLQLVPFMSGSAVPFTRRLSPGDVATINHNVYSPDP